MKNEKKPTVLNFESREEQKFSPERYCAVIYYIFWGLTALKCNTDSCYCVTRRDTPKCPESSSSLKLV